MKRATQVLTIATLGCLCFAGWDSAMAQTRSQRCDAYARNAMRQTPTTTGVVRGAARGAVGGAILGDAGRGAAVGAAVGGTRRVVQKSRSYNYYFDSCMRS